MKYDSPSIFRRLKVTILITVLLSAMSAHAANTTLTPGTTGARYISVGYKKLPDNVQGSGMTYGLGFRSGHFGMEIYSAWMQTIPNGMEKIPAELWGGGTPTGETHVADPAVGFDLNFFMPVTRGIEMYAGPSLNFEKVAQVYESDGSTAILGGPAKGQRYSDWMAHTKTRINGQAGVAISIPTGYKYNAYLMAGYSIYRGLTGSIGFSF